VRLEGDGPMVEELELLLKIAVGREFWRDTTLVTTAQLTGGFFGSSPSLWRWCSVLLYVVSMLFVWCSLRRVMYTYLFFLYDMTVLVPSIKKTACMNVIT
jgi:hypothetical protein